MESRLEEKGRSSAILAVGLSAGVLGVAAGLLAIFVGGAGLLITAEAGEIIWLGMVAVVLGITGSVGALTASSNPRLSAVVMTISGLGGFFAVTVFWFLPGILFLLGAWLAWSSRQRRRPARA